ncbi:XrtA/PEP-CTERM system TPR-repeat protein PrsT [Paraglaciecola sp.]|uniref:XrtA/PEP-CTERM system TPR-repeat protein PrsT n=1 Tax=Paraglaciecola sp. TaxID=1920173 RepID=UPI00273E3EF3|nr:XrtA/PEP-CTERM system TPR-repeat protein PrsT [Paraglaciecola sp.]MDP5032426.1 PEP-CTERM system TPR-repeat protein PrsT [Paraglaciecola sp.]
MPPFLFKLLLYLLVKLKLFFMPLKLIALFFILISSQSNALASSLGDYEKALTSYNAKKYDEAFIHLKNSLQQDPDNLAAKILMGQILLINGYLTAAEVEFNEALQQGADINIIAEPLGNALLFQNKYQEILDLNYTDKLIVEQKVKWLLIRATACVRLKQYDCATTTYNEALALDANSTMSLNGLAAIALFQKNYKAAEGFINQSMAISRTEATTWRQKGQLSRAMGNIDQAIDELQQALKLNSNDPLTLRSLADLYLESNDFDGARTFVNEIIEKTPDDPLAILLSSWLDSKDKSKPVNNERLDRLNNILSSLGPDVIAAQPELLYISGLTAFFNGNTEQASKDFAKYLTKNPNDMQAVILLSRTYMATQQNKQALLLLEKYQSKLLENLDSALLLGELFINSNRAFKAQSLLDELEPLYPNDSRLQLFKIKLMMVRGKQEEALAILDKGLAQNIKNPTYLFTYSMLNLQGNKKEKALDGANALIKLYPDDANFLNLKAGILIRLNKLDEAIVLIEKTLSLEPNLFPAKFNLASIYSRKGELAKSNNLIESLLAVSPTHLQVLTLKAHNLVADGQLDNAIALYSDIIVLNPRDQYAKSQLATIYMRMGNYESALYHVDRLLAENFDNAEYQLQKAQILLPLKRFTELDEILKRVSLFSDLPIESLILTSQLQRAIKDYTGAIRSLTSAETLAPNNTYITLDKVKLLIESSQLDEAAAIISRIESANQKNANFWLIKALYANALKSESNAVKYLKTALELDPNFHQALIILYDMSIRGSQETDFVKQARKLLEINPKNILAKNLLAQFYYIQQDFAQASALYKALLEAEVQINKAEIYNKLAIMSLEDDLQQSANYIEQAFALNENNAKILDTYGWVLSLQGWYEEGLGLLRKAYARDANSPEIRYHIGYTLIKLGRLEEAKNELTMAVNVQRPFYNRPKAQALLDSIK